MKKIYLIAAMIFVSAILFAQDTIIVNNMPMVDSQVEFSKIVQIDSADLKDIYKKAKSATLDVFKSYKAANNFDDKESGIISFSGNFTNIMDWGSIFGISQAEEWLVKFDLTILLKETRYKVMVNKLSVMPLDNPKYQYPIETYYSKYSKVFFRGFGSTKRWREKYYEKNIDFLNDTKRKINGLIDGLISGIQNNKKFDF